MTLRPGPLRAAAALAAGFVVVRVVYRVLFHGADGSGPVLLALPEYRLPPPFGHVVMLGPVTTGGLWDAAASALPIALTILAFGVLNAAVDVPRLFARGARRGPLRGVARTLAVAWATLPALAEAVRAVRFAQRLRGERSGVRLLAPVLARTLARATALAAALELRGLAGHPVSGDCLAPVETEGLVLRHGDGAAIEVPDLALRPGTLTVVTGATGAGKSTLLRALAGLHTHVDGGSARGTVRVVGHDRLAVPPRDTAQRVGVVLQHPREGFATESVCDEIGLTLELRGVAPAIVAARVTEVAERVGIADLVPRTLTGLSAGEAVLVAIAAAIVEHPILLLVDEPLADLDAANRERIVTLLGALARDGGVCVVVAEHRATELDRVADARVPLESGVLPAPATPPAPPRRASATLAAAEPVLRVERLDVRRGTHLVVDGATLALDPGGVVALVGPNGAGKSSLLVALATDTAAATVAGDAPRRGRGVSGVRLVPDASDDLFVCDTVAAECAHADRRAGSARGTTLRRWAELMGDPQQAGSRLGARHPLDLSAGQRRCLAIALQLSSRPRVLLVDEPTRGLDAAARALVAGAIGDIASSGAAVLVATHDQEFAGSVADAVLPMADGRVGAPRALVPAAVSVGAAAVGTTAARDAIAVPGVEPHVGARRAGPDRRDAPTAAPPATAARGIRNPRPGVRLTAVAAANLVALAAFSWPLVAYAVPSQAQAAVPVAAFALVPLAALVIFGALDRSVRSAHTLALLGTLAAIGAAIRIVGTGVGGMEAVFILLILGGRALGARFGLLLGLSTILLSSVVTGGIGPWTPFQMFACAWVGAGAGLLPRRVSGVAEVVMLSVYGVAASYVFGLIMNLWFWPFAVGGGTGISYQPGAPIGENIASFVLYSLLTSSLTWDTLRAIVTVVGVVVVGRAILIALRRAKPVASRH
ncbi:ABC transporter [Microbacterium sp. Root166]|uniref:ATP-binding cassette domain-containing protein n=1 Tax=Microbacterium sp. Root166 TaxID=1736478 RepID=UPI000701CBCF|nr:ABC transporter ATP-binding protein [Microbacterium sp. Root166]KQZ85012.1 ABC transporter [Microbacterium sp. Root166]